MTLYLVKLLVSAVGIVLISEVAKRSSLLGGLIASVPLVSVLAMIWLYAETRSDMQVLRLSTSIFWLTLPSLALFLCLNLLLQRGAGFPLALTGAVLVTALLYGAMVFLLHKVGISL